MIQEKYERVLFFCAKTLVRSGQYQFELLFTQYEIGTIKAFKIAHPLG